MIEFALLEQLDAFARCGTLSAAAMELHLSQPSLTRSMRKLEDQLGVSLFTRQKNRLVLNETGVLAASHARRILEAETEMERSVRAYARSLSAITVGSCAPGPLMVLLPRLTGIFPGQTVSSAVASEEELLQGLRDGTYSFVFLNHPLEAPGLVCHPYLTEHLYLSVPHFHTAALQKETTFAEMDGQNFLMLAQVGFWDALVRREMPHSRFFLQQDLEALGELTRYSDLPSFVTNVTLRVLPDRRNGRVDIPFSDPSARAQFFLVCQAESEKRWTPLLNEGPLR